MARTYTARDNVRLAYRCQRCHNWLTNNDSVKVRMGRVCRDHARAEREDRRTHPEEQGVLFSPEQLHRQAS